MDTNNTLPTDQPKDLIPEAPSDISSGMSSDPVEPALSNPKVSKSSLGKNKMLVFGGLALMITVLASLAIIIPKGSTEDRSQASSVGACIGQSNVAASACNEKCGADADCMTGMICYKTTGATEGVCRSSTKPTSTTCGVVASTTPTPSPIVACKQACTYNYDCNLAAGESCVGTNANNSTPGIFPNAPRAATTAELAALASDQVISMGITNEYKPDANGKMNFSVVSKRATTFTINVFDITAARNQLDPQKLVYSKTYPIGANQTVTGTVILPRCGRYQVDFGSPIVAGTKYDANPAAHYFWGTVFEIPCQNGCCQAPKVVTTPTKTALSQTITVGQTVTYSQRLVRLSLLDIAAAGEMKGYTGLGATSTITSATTPAFTIAAVSFPNVFPAGAGSVKFEVNGQVARIDNEAPFTASDTAIKLPAGTYPIKATLYSLNNAAGSVLGTLSTTLTVK